LVLTENDSVIAYISIEDQIKKDALEIVKQFKNKGLQTILLSGDNQRKCEYVKDKLGLDKIYFSASPTQKMEIIKSIKKNGKIIYVGDGINDAPSLETADIGISFAQATQVAIHSSDVVILSNTGLKSVFDSYQLGNQTLLTIKQNLFWAFFYNVLAIPVAAMGFLSPTVAAFSMALSDLFVIGNSIRLKYKKIW